MSCCGPLAVSVYLPSFRLGSLRLIPPSTPLSTCLSETFRLTRWLTPLASRFTLNALKLTPSVRVVICMWLGQLICLPDCGIKQPPCTSWPCSWPSVPVCQQQASSRLVLHSSVHPQGSWIYIKVHSPATASRLGLLPLQHPAGSQTTLSRR